MKTTKEELLTKKSQLIDNIKLAEISLVIAEKKKEEVLMEILSYQKDLICLWKELTNILMNIQLIEEKEGQGEDVIVIK